mmetsp:Transcript_3058/g.6874  ORF Transcript_3058/g.6874 Transcript_3058/m.6874 type:complete len:203 (-) Transcript_3058:714-1322(-)
MPNCFALLLQLCSKTSQAQALRCPGVGFERSRRLGHCLASGSFAVRGSSNLEQRQCLVKDRLGIITGKDCDGLIDTGQKVIMLLLPHGPLLCAVFAGGLGGIEQLGVGLELCFHALVVTISIGQHELRLHLGCLLLLQSLLQRQEGRLLDSNEVLKILVELCLLPGARLQTGCEGLVHVRKYALDCQRLGRVGIPLLQSGQT